MEKSPGFILHRHDGEFQLDTGEGIERWRRFDATHRLSAEARTDWHLHDSDNVSIQWAVPLDRMDVPVISGLFFPTNTASLVAGILKRAMEDQRGSAESTFGILQRGVDRSSGENDCRGITQPSDKHRPRPTFGCAPGEGKNWVTRNKAFFFANCLYSNLRDQKIVPDQARQNA